MSRAARKELEIRPCYLCMEEKLGTGLERYNGGLACRSCIEKQKRMERNLAKKRKQQT